MSIIISLIISPVISYACNITDRTVETLTDRNGEPVSYRYSNDCETTTSHTETGSDPVATTTMDELETEMENIASENINEVMNKKLVSKLLFSYNSSKVKPSSQDVLMNTAQQLDNISYKKVVIKGFADVSGRKSYNKELSLKRAKAVKNWLTKWGVPRNKVSVEALGENVAKTQREARRVEISVIQ